jgi:hypothetical protein
MSFHDAQRRRWSLRPFHDNALTPHIAGPAPIDNSNPHLAQSAAMPTFEAILEVDPFCHDWFDIEANEVGQPKMTDCSCI